MAGVGEMWHTPMMLKIVQSFHKGSYMQVEVRIGASVSGCVEVKKGLQQGCTLASSLFNIYFSAVIASWQGG